MVEYTPTEPAPEPSFMNLRQYAMLLWHWAWLIVLVAVLAGAAAYVQSSRTAPVYQASTRVLVNEAPTTRTNDYASVQTSQVMARTYAVMMIDRPVLEGVITRLGIPADPDALKQAITVTPQRDTQLITVYVEDTNPYLASDVANALVVVFTERIQAVQASRFALSKDSLQKQVNDMEAQIDKTTNELAAATDKDDRARLETKLTQYRQIYSQLVTNYEQVRLAEAQATTSVVQVEPAIPPLTPIRPKVMQNTILAVLIGVLLAVGGVFALEALDDTVKNPDEVSRRFGLPVLGVIAHHQSEDGAPVTINEPRSPVSEAFRSLRTNVQYASVDHPLRRILVTSPTPSEGKTTVITNLAVVMAQGGMRVTIMDADMRRPRLHRLLGATNRYGLSSLFVRPSDQINGIFQPTRQEGLQVITSGQLPPNPSELLGSQKMYDVLEHIQALADVVLIDTPPIMSVTDAVVLSPFVDGLILVVKPGKTKMTALQQTVEQLRRVNANVIGVVMNDLEFSRSRYGYYYKSYYSSYYYVETPSGRRIKKKVQKAPGANPGSGAPAA